MKKEQMITVSEFCGYHNLEQSYLFSLIDIGLVNVIKIEENIYIPFTELKNLEMLIRLQVEMDINVEGIETIIHLLQRLKNMQMQILHLTNKLYLYENEY
jgi:hypothetical protein